MLGFIFCHGWGHDLRFWDRLKPYFKDHPCIFWDLGYFGDQVQPIPIEDPSIQWVGIGHSLGFLKLLNATINWSKLIGLQAFINFQGNAPSLRRKRSRDLVHLQKHFDADALAALALFHEIGGSKKQQPADRIMHQDRLAKDLALLGEAHPPRAKLPCLVLGCEDDLIVTKELIQDNFGPNNQVQIVIHDKGLHALGFNEPEFVKNAIFDFCNVK